MGALRIIAASSALAALHPNILGGTASDDTQNASVMLFHLGARDAAVTPAAAGAPPQLEDPADDGGCSVAAARR